MKIWTRREFVYSEWGSKSHLGGTWKAPVLKAMWSVDHCIKKFHRAKVFKTGLEIMLVTLGLKKKCGFLMHMSCEFY